MHKPEDHLEAATRLLTTTDPQITGSVSASLDSAKAHALLALVERMDVLTYLLAAAVGVEAE